MDLSAVAVAAFAVGTAGNSVKAVPQFVRTALHGRVAGLSPAAVWLAFGANVLWLAFGVAIQDWRFVALGIAQTVLTAGTLARFVMATGWKQNARPAWVAVPVCVVVAMLAVADHEVMLETLGAAVGVLIGAPQLLYLWRRRNTVADVSGVAATEYVVVITAQVAWTVYWLVEGHPIAAAGAAWGGAARAVTLGLLRMQTARAAAGPG